ncbi:MAG TPA: Hsp20/alpha crystallin family protein [Methylothermaceae bacterium]|nr:Hsp20/alpha crystallin family protein [Methylothermaceae bacterium]
MSALEQLRQGFQHAFESVAEGWRHLRERTSQALTRFTQRETGESAEQQLMIRSPRWGLLPAEIKEEKDKIVVRLEVPGMEPDQFDIQVMGDTLVVHGEKVAEREQVGGRYYLLERAYGAFERAIPLPVRVRETGAEATYRRGVLTIELPKETAETGRRIPIRIG